MEPNLFAPYQLLTKLASAQASGLLNISNGRATWHVYLNQGELHYADCSIQTLAQLSYFLCRQTSTRVFNALKEMPKAAVNESITATTPQSLIEQSITWLREQHQIDDIQTKQLLEDVTQDALETFLWLRQGQATWNMGVRAPDWVIQILREEPLLELEDTMRFLQQRMQGWQSCGKDIWSPYQRPYLLDFRNVSKPITGGKLSPEALAKLTQLMNRGFSLRQLSVLLKQDELHVAQLLVPYVEQSIIYLRNPQPPFDHLPRVPAPKLATAVPSAQVANQDYKIVCIDDSPTILHEIERFLGEKRYKVTTVADPIQASAVIFREKPDLILLDITMPKINGYRLCSLLRSSSMFDDTPIIMVTGNTGLIDKARAKLAGATDYFTKPFTRNGLLNLVEKHLTQFSPI